MIVKDLRPVNIVENEGFRYFIAALDPLFTLPSRKTLREKWIPLVYNEVKEYMKKEFIVQKTV